MANETPDENGSKFYITLRENVDYLDEKHTIFGWINWEEEDSFATLNKLNKTLCDMKSKKPLERIRIKHTVILDDPFEGEDEELENI